MMENKKYALLVAEGCPACGEAKKIFGNAIEYLDVTKDELATKIALELGIDRVPTPLLIKDDNGRKVVCKLSKDMKEEGCIEIPPPKTEPPKTPKMEMPKLEPPKIEAPKMPKMPKPEVKPPKMKASTEPPKKDERGRKPKKRSDPIEEMWRQVNKELAEFLKKAISGGI